VGARVGARALTRSGEHGCDHSNTCANLLRVGGGWSSSRAATFRRSLADQHGEGDGHDQHGHDQHGHDGGDEHVASRGRAAGQPADGGSRGGRGTHCWVLMPDADPMPGVVAGWRRDGAGAWEARVAYALGDDGTSGTSGVVTGWLPASCLRPYRV